MIFTFDTSHSRTKTIERFKSHWGGCYGVTFPFTHPYLGKSFISCYHQQKQAAWHTSPSDICTWASASLEKSLSLSFPTWKMGEVGIEDFLNPLQL